MRELSLHAFEYIPLVQRGDDIGMIICKVAKKENFIFEDNDIVVVTSKIVSKSEGRLINTCKIKPSRKATLLAKKLKINPENLEVILKETKRLLIAKPGFILTESRSGFISTKAGVDSSNTMQGPKGQIVSILPEDPDASAKKIRQTIKINTGKEVAVIINDTFGRSDRKGSVGMAIGISGITAIYFPPNQEDIHGKKRHPEIAQVDEIAAGASLLMGQTNERRPVVVVKGVEYQHSETSKIGNLLHPIEKYFQDAQDVLSQQTKKK